PSCSLAHGVHETHPIVAPGAVPRDRSDRKPGGGLWADLPRSGKNRRIAIGSRYSPRVSAASRPVSGGKTRRVAASGECGNYSPIARHRPFIYPTIALLQTSIDRRFQTYPRNGSGLGAARRHWWIRRRIRFRPHFPHL